jgi:uncharacterized protein with PQ loop repeat
MTESKEMISTQTGFVIYSFLIFYGIGFLLFMFGGILTDDWRTNPLFYLPLSMMIVGLGEIVIVWLQEIKQ